MKGYVATPKAFVDLMVSKLFESSPPTPESTILDPGCGTGAFIDGIIQWCNARRLPLPKIVGVELDPRHIPEARTKFDKYPSIRIEQRDFLVPGESTYDYIIGNPPYVPITKLSGEEKDRYRALYETARGRFDLYLLFFEQALRNLRDHGRLVFVTPEKFLYVETAAPLRRLLSTKQVEEIRMVEEQAFGKLVTYPTVTTITNSPNPCQTIVVLRKDKTTRVMLPKDGSSWLPDINGRYKLNDKHRLTDICLRVSCGVATGADSVFVCRSSKLDPILAPFAYPTIAGRELTVEMSDLHTNHVMLIPYSRDGRLLKPKELGAFFRYMSRRRTRERLLRRTCVSHKPWYAFHENPPLSEIMLPKVLCKDIAARPHFWIDKEGTIVPRHSVYYIVPREPSQIEELTDYLNSETARRWLEANCQRAANGFLRLQSRILKQLPIPQRLAETSEVATASPYPLGEVLA
jgi:adenine-specific DNA-methyltransferase